MSEREIDPMDVGLSGSHEQSLQTARIVLTRHRAAIVVVIGYTAMALCAKLFLSYLESTQGYDDARDDQAAMIFAAVLAILCVKALINIYRPVKPLT